MVNRPTGEIGRLLISGDNSSSNSTGCGCECTDCLETGTGTVTDCEYFDNMPSVYYSLHETPDINQPGRLDYISDCTYESESFEYTSPTDTVYNLKWVMRVVSTNGVASIELSIEDAV